MMTNKPDCSRLAWVKNASRAEWQVSLSLFFLCISRKPTYMPKPCREYLINMGILPAAVFPLEGTIFTARRQLFVAYQATYQLGVFVSRTYSIKLCGWLSTWCLAIAQVTNVLVVY